MSCLYRPQRLVEDDAKLAKTSDFSVTSVSNHIPSLVSKDAANHLIVLSKTPVGSFGGSAGSSSSDVGKNKNAAFLQHTPNSPLRLHAVAAESTHPMKQPSVPTAHFAKGNVCMCLRAWMSSERESKCETKRPVRAVMYMFYIFTHTSTHRRASGHFFSACMQERAYKPHPIREHTAQERV